MNLLLIEDQDSFITQVREAVGKHGSVHRLLTAKDDEVGLIAPMADTASFEEQFLARLKGIQEKHAIDLVLLDTDLSRFQSVPISQTICRQALQEIGLPVCRYKKTYKQTTSNRLRDLKRIAREGASAVWVPPELVRGHDVSNLINWLETVDSGFKQIYKRLLAEIEAGRLKKSLGPAGILARVLGKSSLRGDLLGYTSQNLFFFAAPLGEDDADEIPPSTQVLAARLGYWLLNYVLTFPGPILNENAAAALLNLTPASFQDEAVQTFVAPAKYAGPFDGIDTYYWRAHLARLIDEAGGDIAAVSQFADRHLARVDSDTPGAPAYLCVLSGEPVKRSEAANPSPDWIPPGAELTRVRQDLLDDLDPMLSI